MIVFIICVNVSSENGSGFPIQAVDAASAKHTPSKRELSRPRWPNRDDLEGLFYLPHNTPLTIRTPQNGAECPAGNLYGLDCCRALQLPRAEDMPELLDPRLAQLLQRHDLPPHYL